MSINLLSPEMSTHVELLGTARKLTLNGETRAYPIYRIRLEDLYYNDQNDRIASWISQYNSEHGTGLLESLDREQYNRVIEDFIVQSNPVAIDRTQMNIEMVGQREAGVVLTDGRVIDGNRRFTCMRRLHQKDSSFEWFEAVILDRILENSRKEIKMLELAIQHGEEQKVEYSPLDRLVGVYQDIVETSMLTVEEYAESTNESVADVNRRVAQAKLLVEFLEYIHMPKQYYVARDYQAVNTLNELSDMLRRQTDAEQVKKIKESVFTNIMMKTLGDGRKFLRNIKAMNENGLLPAYLREQEKISTVIAERMEEKEPQSKAELDQFVAHNGDLSEDLENSMDRSLLKAKRKETRNKPAQIVTKSMSMLKDVDLRIVEKLDEDEREKLRTQVNKLEQMVAQFDEYIDQGQVTSAMKESEPTEIPRKEYRIAPVRLEMPELVCLDAGSPVHSLTLAMRITAENTRCSTMELWSGKLIWLDENFDPLIDEIAMQVKVGDVRIAQCVLDSRASGLKKCFLGIRTDEDAKGTLSKLIPFDIQMTFSVDMDF